MAKRKKGNTQQSVNRYSLQECERRPVKKSDKWCYIISRPKVNMDNHPAPYGYIVTIPFLPNVNTQLEGVEGTIIRSKKHCGSLLLQVVPTGFRVHGIGSFTRHHEPNASKKKRKKKKKLYRILNIRNMQKRIDLNGQYKW